jgi:hypothetical protein
LKHDGHKTDSLVGIGNGKRDALTTFIDSENDKLAGFGRLNKERHVNLKHSDRGRKVFGLYNLRPAPSIFMSVMMFHRL